MPVLLADVEGVAYKEIAEVMECSIGTVMSRICRARKALKAALSEFDPRHDYARANIRRIK